jgi:hypothetical protein
MGIPMPIKVNKYDGDYSDLGDLEWNGEKIPRWGAQIWAEWDMYVGYEDNKPLAYFLISKEIDGGMSLNPLHQGTPYIGLVVNQGSLSLGRALKTAIKNAVVARGHSSFYAIHFTEQLAVDSSVWVRTFRPMGVATQEGIIYKFDAKQ